MLDELRKVGLTEYESRIYLLLLKEGSTKGGDICKKTGVPHGKTYSALHSLAEKGFVSILPIKPKLFKAIKPKQAISSFVEKKIESFKQLEKEAAEKLEEVAKVQLPKEEVTEKLTVIAGHKNSHRLVDELLGKAKKSVKFMFTYEHQDFLNLREFIGAKKRGADIKILASLMTASGLKLMKEDVKRGFQVRYYRVQEIRMLVIDGVEAYLSIKNPKKPGIYGESICLIIDSKEFAKLLENYFDYLWEKAESIK